MKKRIDKNDNNINKKKEKEEKCYNKKHKLLKLIIFIFLFAFFVSYYMRFIETNRLVIKEIKVESTKVSKNLSGLKLVHISDLHYKTTIDKHYLKKLVKEINKLKPDILVFTGDLLNQNIHYSNKDYEDLSYNLKKINSNTKYYVMGNEDYKNENSSTILESAGFISINNKEDCIYGSDNSKIIIHGIGSFIENDFDTTTSFITNDKTFFNIAVFHEPDNILELQDKNIDLVLTGHSLNNRINLPIIKEINSVEGALDYYDSYYNIDNTHMYINAGIGTNGNRLRLFTPPTINFYRIVKK